MDSMVRHIVQGPYVLLKSTKLHSQTVQLLLFQLKASKTQRHGTTSSHLVHRAYAYIPKLSPERLETTELMLQSKCIQCRLLRTFGSEFWLNIDPLIFLRVYRCIQDYHL